MAAPQLDSYCSGVLRKLRNLLLTGHCPVLPWWACSGHDELHARVRGVSGCGWLRGRNPALRVTARLIVSLLWPIRSFGSAFAFTRKHGSWAGKEAGGSRLRQFAQQLQLAWWHGLPPLHYYQFVMFRDGGWEAGLQRLNPSEGANLLSLLNDDTSNQVVRDKELFGRWCAENQLPSPALISVAKAGETIGELPELPEGEGWFVKPATGFGGRLTERWLSIGKDRLENHAGEVLTRAELARRLSMAGAGRPLLVQRCLKNHSELDPITNGALASLRVITARYPDGRVICVSLLLRLPVGDSITDNHGLLVPISNSGKTGKAIGYSPRAKPTATHPDTEKTIEDLSIPFCTEARDTCLHGHSLIESHVFIAWDVALTPEGLQLLEANSNWDVLGPQKAHGNSLLETEFADVVREQISAMS